MKKVFSLPRKFLLISSVVAMSALILSSCDKKDNNDNNKTTYSISGNASGSQMMPAVSDSGKASISGTYDASTRVLNYTTTWTNLTGAPTSAAFYAGASGANGTMVGSNWNMGTGLNGTGTYTGQVTLTADQASQLLNGGWYYVISTSSNPNGEVRGQITATPM